MSAENGGGRRDALGPDDLPAFVMMIFPCRREVWLIPDTIYVKKDAGPGVHSSADHFQGGGKLVNRVSPGTEQRK